MEGDTGPGITLGAKFKALSSPYRRRLLNALREKRSLSDEDLLEMFDDHRSRSRRLIECRQIHLPILSDLGLIELRGDLVERGKYFDDIEPFLELLNSRDPDLPHLL